MDGNKSNVLIALVGESGSGKSAIAKYLEDFYDLKYVRSYTTRPKRADKIDDHIYVDQAQYDCITHKAAESYYNNNWYCATEHQCDMADVYVIDVQGLKMLKEKYKNKHILSLYINTPLSVRIQRMKDRGDDQENINKRVDNDNGDFNQAWELCDYDVDNEGSLTLTCGVIVARLEQFKRHLRKED